jgi:hypothetical protein
MSRVHLAVSFFIAVGALAAYAADPPSSAPAASTQPAPQSAASFDSLALCHVRGMALGVREIWLYGDGKLVVQVTDLVGSMKRYESKASDAEVQTLRDLLAKHNFAELTVESKYTIPDEGSGTITLKSKDGAVHSVKKWDATKSDAFVAIEKELWTLSKRAETTPPVAEGKYDGKFAPRDEPKPKASAVP